MALEKQMVSIPLTGGLDTKTAQTLTASNKFLTLQNARFLQGSNAGGLQKRNGYQALASKDLTGATLSNATALATYNGQLLLVASGKSYSYSVANAAWAQLGRIGALSNFTQNVVPFGVTRNSIARGTSSFSAPDSATLNGITVYACNVAGGLQIVVVDEASGYVYQSSFQANFVNPRVVSDGSNRLIVFAASTVAQLAAFTVQTASPAAGIPTAFIELGSSTICTGSGVFDVMWYATGGYFIGIEQTSIGIVLRTWSSTLLPGPTTTVWTGTTVYSLTLALTSASVPLEIAASWLNGSTVTVSSAFYTPPAGYGGSMTAGSMVTLATYAAPNAVPLVASVAVGANALIYWQLEPNTPATALHSIQWASHGNSGIVSAAALFVRNAALAWRPWAPTTSQVQVLVPILFASTIQPTYVLLAHNQVAGTYAGQLFEVIGSFAAGIAQQSWNTNGRLAATNALRSSVYQIATSVQVQTTTQGSVLGVSELVLDFTVTGQTGVQLGQNTQLTGALSLAYDGASLTEQNFCVYPDAVTVTLVNDFANWSGKGTATPTLTFPTYQGNSSSSGTGTTNLGAGATSDASLIAPGTYWIVSFVSGGTRKYFCVWYKVSGVGTVPVLGGSYTYIQVTTVATKTAALVAQDTAVFLNASAAFTTYASATNTGNQVSFTYVGGVSSEIGPYWRSDYALLIAATTTMKAPPGALLKASQFWVAPTTPVALSFAYYWVQLDGIGVDPGTIPNNGISTATGYKLAISSSDTATSVASKIATALNTSDAGWSASSTGDFVSFSLGGLGAFNPSPNVFQQSAGSGSGSTLSAGNYIVDSYSFEAIYSRVDNAGQLHRSGASPPTIVGIPSWGGDQGSKQYVFQVTVPALQLSNAASNNLRGYRTANGGTTFYLVTSPITPPAFAPNAQDLVTVLDQTSDVALVGLEQIYTGAQLPNSQPPALISLAAYKNRLWGVPAETPNSLWFSQAQIVGAETQWSNALQIPIDTSGGPVVAVVGMDSNLIVLAANKIWIITGDGPSPNVAIGGFNTPQLINSAVGCRDPLSVVQTPDGVIFKSAKGFYLLDRSLQVQYIGADVEAFNADVVVSATVIANTTEIRFLSATGTTLVYDYYYKQWGTFTNHQGLEAVLFQGSYTYVRAGGGTVAVWQEGGATDAGTAFSMVAQTAWIKVNGIQGFGRVWKSIWKGYFPGPMQVTCAYSYPGGALASSTHTVNSGSSGNTWGSDATWGASSPWGGIAGSALIYQFRIRNTVQKVESISFTIQDLTPFTPYMLDALDLEIGVKKGGYKHLGPGQSA